MRVYVYLWVYTSLCVSMGVYGEGGGLWVWDLSTHEVPTGTRRHP